MASEYDTGEIINLIREETADLISVIQADNGWQFNFRNDDMPISFKAIPLVTARIFAQAVMRSYNSLLRLRKAEVEGRKRYRNKCLESEQELIQLCSAIIAYHSDLGNVTWRQQREENIREMINTIYRYINGEDIHDCW